jgi:protease PrsW
MESQSYVPDVEPRSQKRGLWWRFLLTAFVFYLVGLVILILTHNPNLFPAIVMLGSFIVPGAYVAFFYERRHLSRRLTLPVISLCFFYGGFLGVFAASLLEPLFIRNLNILTAFEVGFIEEFAKILGVLVIARHLEDYSEMEGIILGAAAGMGFAALESSGYAFTAFLASGGSLSVTVGVILLRGLLSPLGHGTWTAIFVGVLFRESREDHFHINGKVIETYFLVSILHGLWDGLPGVIAFITGSGLDVLIAQSVIGLIGLAILYTRWREAVRKPVAV